MSYHGPGCCVQRSKTREHSLVFPLPLGRCLVMKKNPNFSNLSGMHQQLTRQVCHESQFSNEYQVGDSFSLYDLNGEYNGGEYHVMFFDMSATW